MKLTESENQILIALIELDDPIETPNNNFYAFYPKDIEAASTYFKSLKVDWNKGLIDLLDKKLIVKSKENHILSEEGKEIAGGLRRARPPIYYWYREFYPAVSQSKAYEKFCSRLYGKNLCQAGFSDMTQIDAMVSFLELETGSHCLDMGCGTGMVAEYISDQTGAKVSGVDYCPEAIEIASQRTKPKRNLLSFYEGNLDNLEFLADSFNSIISIDTLYMPNDLKATILRMVELLKSDGRMAIFYTHSLWDGGTRESLNPEKTPLGIVLKETGMTYQTLNFSKQTYELMQLKRKIGEEMKPSFQEEGNMSIYQFIINESESSQDAYNPETCSFARYLYQVTL
jgi:ubiquinone/menaquinone biosynthesis C-methylase UbiE